MDLIAIAAIVLGVLILGVVATMWTVGGATRSPKPEPARPPAQDADAPPTFNVVSLGLQGSGKTVLLSSMFHGLNYRSPSRPYHLETRAEDAVVLARIRAQIIDPEKPWPASTPLPDKHEYPFDFVAYDAAERRRTILRMSYLEYAGEIFEGSSAESRAQLKEVEAHVREAHALLGLIDGYRLRQLLLSDPAADGYFQAVLLPMLGFMQRATCPIQLVVTKWDDLRDLGDGRPVDDGLRFKEVMSALMDIPQVKALVSFAGSRRLRVIPVSAVGIHFADLDDGREPPKKRSNATLAPINVDVPLCAVVPDLLRQVESSLDEPLQRRVRRYVRGRLWQDARSLVLSLLQSPAGAVLRGVTEAVVFLEWMLRRTPGTRRVPRAPGGDLELQRLRAELIRHMEGKVDHLGFTHPDSVS